MTISVACPGCSATMNVPDSAIGKKVRCLKPGCGVVVPVPLPPNLGFEVVEDEPPVKARSKTIEAVVAKEEDDDDDRPRKKFRRDDEDNDDDYEEDRTRRKKKGKKSGLGAGVIVAIVFGSLFVVAGLGFGIYALVGGSKAPVPKGWVEYKSESDKFVAFFPEKPKSQIVPAGIGADPAAESISLHAVNSGSTGGRIAVVVVVKFKPGTSEADRDKAMKKFGERFTERGNNSASSPRSVRWGGYKADEITIDDKGTSANGKKGGGVMRYFATDSRAYIGIFGTEEGGQPESEDVNGFFDNFEFLK